ncbi:hypothetical protein ABBQ38_014465 [Trebouxia sp. C0009 RCD-2024]
MGQSVLDLRAVPRVCQNHVKQPSPGCCPCVVNPFEQPAKITTQGLRELFIAPPSHCLACSDAFQEEHGHEALVYHASLVDSKLRLFIFGHVPMAVKLRTVLAPAMGTNREAVMAPAVADASKLGYAKLYRLILDHVVLSDYAQSEVQLRTARDSNQFHLASQYCVHPYPAVIQGFVRLCVKLTLGMCRSLDHRCCSGIFSTCYANHHGLHN